MGMMMMSMGQSLQPGEVVKNSGKFTKPTKIPGKNYSKDEIIIRNADSGKGEFSGGVETLKQIFTFNSFCTNDPVMGIKGRRVHIIEEMSNCVISFQRGKVSLNFNLTANSLTCQ